MLCVAAARIRQGSVAAASDFGLIHDRLAAVAGGGAALAFGVALMASGLSSSTIGTQAGQVVMDGFIRRRIPLVVRRLVTLAPAVVVLALGIDPTKALVASQVVLSFGIPFALVPLVMLTSEREIMGELVNRKLTTVAASVVAGAIILLNVFLLYRTIFA